jgi:hypothetical protein
MRLSLPTQSRVTWLFNFSWHFDFGPICLFRKLSVLNCYYSVAWFQKTFLRAVWVVWATLHAFISTFLICWVRERRKRWVVRCRTRHTSVNCEEYEYVNIEYVFLNRIGSYFDSLGLDSRSHWPNKQAKFYIHRYDAVCVLRVPQNHIKPQYRWLSILCVKPYNEWDTKNYSLINTANLSQVAITRDAHDIYRENVHSNHHANTDRACLSNMRRIGPPFSRGRQMFSAWFLSS